MSTVEAPPIATIPRSPDQVREDVVRHRQHSAVDPFHKLWYGVQHTWSMTRWRGIPTLKCPLDLFIYSDIISQLRPALIIETGTAFCGSALWYADVCSLFGTGQVVTIDLVERLPTMTSHPRITRILGDSVSDEVLVQVRDHVTAADGPVLVSLDSAHEYEHVRRELDLYAPFVTPDSFLVVEDTNIHGHPVAVMPDNDGPMAAVTDFLASHPEFGPEPLCERYLLTMHPGGWLRRRKD